MITYRMYGLNVASEFPVAGERCVDERPDITIRNEPISLPEMKHSTVSQMLYHVSDHTIHLHWDDVGSFRIHAGTEITATRAPGAGEKIFSRTLTGTALALALFQRGYLILHASAVVANGGAVLFSGDCGFGKSTIASSLHSCGHLLLADDIAAIHVGETTHQVFPGNQEFKLWPDSVRNIGENEESLHRFTPQAEKRLLPVSERLQRQPVPLRLIYMLGFSEKAGIEPIDLAQATIELVRNTYGVTLLHEIRTADFFQQIVRVARSVAILRLTRERSLESFSNFLAMVRQDMSERLR